MGVKISSHTGSAYVVINVSTIQPRIHIMNVYVEKESQRLYVAVDDCLVQRYVKVMRKLQSLQSQVNRCELDLVIYQK